jgi:hypothetical protein
VLENLKAIFEDGISALEDCHKKETIFGDLWDALESALDMIPLFRVIHTVYDVAEYVFDGITITKDVEAMLTAYKRAQTMNSANEMVLVGQHLGDILSVVIQLQKKR